MNDEALIRTITFWTCRQPADLSYLLTSLTMSYESLYFCKILEKHAEQFECHLFDRSRLCLLRMTLAARPVGIR